MRNNVLDANYTQLNAAGKPRGKHIVNQFSGTIGGPLRKELRLPVRQLRGLA